MSELTKKTERLASAIYLITSFFDDHEPLKWRLRTISTELMSKRVRDKSSVITEALSLFALAMTVGLISETNHDILIAELSKFRQEVEKPLDIAFFGEEPTAERTLSEPRNPYRVEYLKDKSAEDKIIKKPKLREFGAVSVKKNSRQDTIINLLKRKKEIMIKDVSSLISGCSEKTVQRELLAMVHAGVLKKIGEKRWSRYTLA